MSDRRETADMVEQDRRVYEALRAGHVAEVRAALMDHVARLDWPAERIAHYRPERLRALLVLARARSPFHAERMRDLDPATATVDDLARLPPMTKQDTQQAWDSIITTPGLDRADADGHPVAPTEPAARTLATGLAGHTFPFIRYDLGDEVTLLPEPCPCGSAMPRVAAIAGRRDDDFRYGPLAVPASAFRHVLGTDPRIVEYQVHQTPRGAEVLVVGSPDTAAVAAALAESLRPYGLPDAEIDVRTVEQIPRHATTGKLTRFVALKR
jgi:phenylacetate-coenzyme A ligase PaaK-like adenylate-forming protein